MKFTIEEAGAHNLTNVPKTFYKRTDAKSDKIRGIATGINIPGFLLNLKRRLNKTIIWMDAETLIMLGLLPSGTSVNKAAATRLIGQKIRIK